MKRKYKRKPKEQIKIAKSRIEQLFEQAKQAFNEDKKLANRYVELARKISMKYKVRIPSELKRKFCKNCYSYLVPSKNCRVRVSQGKITYYCLECKHFMRFPYKPKRK